MTDAPLARTDWSPDLTPAFDDVISRARPEKVDAPGYYDVPILKRPLWGWEIATYFFLEGISAGAFVLATIAETLGSPEQHEPVRVARWLSLATLAPCPPLLIADLGRPERFHHMLRIVKATSPMNTGAWALSGYGAFVALAAAQETAPEGMPIARRQLQALQRRVPRAANIAGLPFALTMVSYPGVLLSTTSTPVWAHTHLLGALIACSSMSSAAAAMTMLIEIRGIDGAVSSRWSRFETIAAAAEAIALAGYLVEARRAVRPIVTGSQAKLLWGGAVATGLVAPTLLRLLSARAGAVENEPDAGEQRRSGSRALSILASALTLAGAFALKWAIVHAGRESAQDRELANRNARP